MLYNNPMTGRPTKYDPDKTPDQVWEYLNTYNLDGKEVIPTVAGLSVFMGVHKDTLYEWAKHEDKKAFSDAFKWVMPNQEVALLNGALKGEMNPVIAKMVSVSNHGYSDKVSQEVTSPDGSLTPQTIVIVGPPEDDDEPEIH